MKSDLVRGDYERARRKSFVRAIASWLRRSDNALLAFEQMRQGIHAKTQRDGGAPSYSVLRRSAANSAHRAATKPAHGRFCSTQSSAASAATAISTARSFPNK